MNDTSAHAVPWLVPELLQPVPDQEPEPPSELLPEAQRQALIEAAHDQGFQQGLEEGRAQGEAQGHAEGLAQAQAEMQRLSAQLQGIIDSFTHPLARLDKEVIRALAELAVRIAGQLVRRSYSARPALMQHIISEALQAAGPSAESVEIRLHPEDVNALQPLLTLQANQQLYADSSLQRGDVRIHAPSVRIDAGLDTRLQQILEQLFRPKPSTA